MKIGIDVSPIENKLLLAHRVRGTGFYIQHLRDSLLKYYPDNNYIFFTREKPPQNADIVHYPYFEPFFLSLPFLSKNKRVVTVHDLTPLVFSKHFPVGIKGKIKWFLQKLALARTDAIITDSVCSKNDIVRYGGIPSEKITVVYLSAGEEFKPVDMSNNSIKQKIEALRKKYKIPKSFALYVGDVTWNKNLPRLIEATSKIGVTLVMVGNAIADTTHDTSNPWNQDLVKVQSSIESNKNIIALGFVSSENLVLLYNIATVFCMPSLYEGFGLPVLEAMRCGCPVIAAKEGSLAEIGGNAALYVNAYSVDSIAEGINMLMKNSSEQALMREKGFRQSSLFSWKKTAHETIKVYETVLTKK